MADTWRVINQKQTQVITAGGTFTDVMEVTVEVTGGTTFVERIPLQAYSADAVKAAVEKRVADILAVEQL